MVILTTAYARQFTTVDILPMFKRLALKHPRHVKSKDESVLWNKFVIPTNLYLPDGTNTLKGEIFTQPEVKKKITLIVTLLMHWQITFFIILPLLSAQMHLLMYIKKLKGLTFHLKMLKYTTGPSLSRSCRMFYIEPMILQQDQMKYIINF